LVPTVILVLGRTKGKNKMDDRQQRGLEIAALLPIKRSGEMYIVPSQRGKGKYQVDANPQTPHCNCPDFELRQSKCKHIFAVEFTVRRETMTIGNAVITSETETVRVTYSQDWTSYNAAQTKEKAYFQRLLHGLCAGISDPEQTRGRPRLSYADMIFSAAFKVYSTVSGRRFMTDLKEAYEGGYLTRLPHYNSIFKYLESADLTPILKSLIIQSALPMKALESDFAIDSSGFSTCQFVRWFDAKYGREMDVHDWIKVHLMCGVRTNVVTSVEISGRHANDVPFLPELVKTTAGHFAINEVSADKAYSTFDAHEAIADAGATPYIAFKKSATGAVGGIFRKMFHLYCMNREEFLTHYHKRSNAETTFSMIKAKFGGRVRSKSATAQINEVLCKVLCHNICCVIQSMFEFNIEPDFWGAR